MKSGILNIPHLSDLSLNTSIWKSVINVTSITVLLNSLIYICLKIRIHQVHQNRTAHVWNTILKFNIRKCPICKRVKYATFPYTYLIQLKPTLILQQIMKRTEKSLLYNYISYTKAAIISVRTTLHIYWVRKISRYIPVFSFSK